MANEQNLKPITSSKMAREMQRKGAKKQAESRKAKRVFRDYLQEWANGNLDKHEKEVLKKMGIDTNNTVTKEALLLIPIITKASKGDIRAWETIQSYLGNNPKQELEIERLKEENKKLKLEQQKLKLELGISNDDKIEVINDVDS